MEQNPSQNQNPGFWQKNQSYLYVLGLVAIVIIVFFASRGQNPAPDEETGEQRAQTQQQANENTNLANEGENQNQTTPSDSSQASERIMASGMLRASDDPNRGNLMLVSGLHKIYIATVRDFSKWLQKEVTMEADGTLNSFVFLGFKEAGSTAGAIADPSAIGGPDDAGHTSEVSASGRLETSDDPAKGNYLIMSGTTNIYLQTVRDYGAWLGSEVNLKAKGTIGSFSEARLSKK